MRVIGNVYEQGVVRVLTNTIVNSLRSTTLDAPDINLVSASYALSASYVSSFSGVTGDEIVAVAFGSRIGSTNFGTTTLHPSCSYAVFELVGAGGGGGAANTGNVNYSTAGRGGNSGNYVLHILTKEEIGTSFGLTTGTGGNAGTATGVGADGSTTSVVLTGGTYTNPSTGLARLEAYGGKGGDGGSNTSGITGGPGNSNSRYGALRNTDQSAHGYDLYSEGEPGSSGFAMPQVFDGGAKGVGRGGTSPVGGLFNQGSSTYYISTNSTQAIHGTVYGFAQGDIPGAGGNGGAMTDSTTTANGSRGGVGMIRVWQFLKA